MPDVAEISIVRRRDGWFIQGLPEHKVFAFRVDAEEVALARLAQAGRTVILRVQDIDGYMRTLPQPLS